VFSSPSFAYFTAQLLSAIARFVLRTTLSLTTKTLHSAFFLTTALWAELLTSLQHGGRRRGWLITADYRLKKYSP
jgi:hypothetical protein